MISSPRPGLLGHGQREELEGVQRADVDLGGGGDLGRGQLAAQEGAGPDDVLLELCAVEDQTDGVEQGRRVVSHAHRRMQMFAWSLGIAVSKEGAEVPFDGLRRVDGLQPPEVEGPALRVGRPLAPLELDNFEQGVVVQLSFASNLSNQLKPISITLLHSLISLPIRA